MSGLPISDRAERQGFTLIELLVVILIILILAGLLLTGWQALQRTLKKTETTAIMQMVLQGLALQESESGAAPPPAEHPFAGTKAPRLDFVGRRDSGWIQLEAGGEALYGVPAGQIASAARDRLIADDDRFAEPDIPGFYGIERRLMGVVGSPLAAVTRFLDLGRAPVDTAWHPAPYLPYDPILGEQGKNRIDHADFTYETADPPHYPDMLQGNPTYPRERCLIEGIQTLPGARVDDRHHGARQVWLRVQTHPTDNAELIDWLFPANLQEELRQLRGLRAPPDDQRLLLSGPPTPAGTAGQAVDNAAIQYGSRPEGYRDVPAVADNPRVWSDDPGTVTWEPGRIRVSDQNLLEGDGRWRTYLLRGPAIYDAWGREILYARTAEGGTYLISAGEDGCFAIVPGLVDANGASIFATDVSAGYDGVPVAPDRDGTTDNVVLSP